MPEGARILSLQVQHGWPMLWAEVDPEMPLKTRSFATYGTGHPMAAVNRSYIGTYFLSKGNLVYHVFELV